MKKVVIALCCIILAVGSLWAQEEKFGNEKIEKIIEEYTAQTSANKEKYALLSSRWEKGDTLTLQEVTFLRCYYTTTSKYKPLKMDEIGKKIYKFNEEEKYEQALKWCEKLKKTCPYNVISFKEAAYALSKLGKECNATWAKAMQILQVMRAYGEDFEALRTTSNVVAFDVPFFPLSLYEGAVFYDASESFPKKIVIMRVADEQVAVMYSAHESGKWAFLSSKWAYFNHAKNFYKNQIVDISAEVKEEE